MARYTIRIVALLLLISLTVSCAPIGSGGRGPATPDEAPVASPTPQPGSGIPQVVILGPLQIDSENGRLYTVAQVNGEPKIAVLNARSGELLAAWDGPGPLALDAGRSRLIVDRGSQGVAVLNAATGELQGTISLPAQDGPVAPQVNTADGLIYAIRGATIHVIDPAIRGVVRTMPIEIVHSVCDTPAGDAPVYDSLFDPVSERLYLSFITQTCIPWATITLVAYDSTLREIGRVDFDISTQFLPLNKSLLGLTVSRLGPTRYWAWDGNALWADQSGDYLGPPGGVAVDVEQQVLYEAVGQTLRVVRGSDRALTAEIDMPLLADGRLAGYDGGSDNLYFITTSGRLYLLPAADLLDQATQPAAAPAALPTGVVRHIVPAPGWATNKRIAAVLDDGSCDGSGRLFLMLDTASGWASGSPGDDDCPTVTAVAYSPDYQQDSLLFAATSRPPTIQRTVDSGRSWRAAETQFAEGMHFIALLPSPGYAADQTIFALSQGGLLYRSRDGGRNWLLLSQRLEHVAMAGNDGPAIHLFGVFGGRVLRSTNGGESWRETGAPPGGEAVSLLAVAPSSGEFPILYAFTAGGTLSRSLDAGQSWQAILQTAPGPAQLVVAAEMPEENRATFFLHEGEINASYDGLASIWASTTISDVSRYRPTAIAIAPDFAASPFLFAGTADGQIIRLRADAQP